MNINSNECSFLLESEQVMDMDKVAYEKTSFLVI